MRRDRRAFSSDDLKQIEEKFGPKIILKLYLAGAFVGSSFFLAHKTFLDQSEGQRAEQAAPGHSEQLHAGMQVTLVRRSCLWRDVGKRMVIKDAGATAQNTSIVPHPTAGKLEQFTCSPEEGVSSVCKVSASTTTPRNAYAERYRINFRF
ncbi:hypothetical protein Tco_1203352 [Tanacetum coccineum]